MLIIPGEVVTGALVNAIAVVGRQMSKAVAGVRKSDDVATARWFETFRLSGTLPDQPDLSPETQDRLARILNGDEIQAALQELLAVRLTDAPQTDASRARDAIRLALTAAGPDAARFAEALADYYDDQICSLVARLEAKDSPLLAQIRSEAFSARIISALHTIARHTAVLADTKRQRTAGQAQAWPRAGDNPAGALRMQPVGPIAGRPLGEVTDPFAVEVHRPVQADNPPGDLPVLPAYVPREHDRTLAEVVQAAAAGSSGIAVLVGGSSTGKTRACWEALGLLRDLAQPWRLWHPIDPSRPGATLRDLPSIGPRTVVWLNEAQFYLDAPGVGTGERVAAGLRELLRDPARGPVLVLATLWPQFWDTLTTRPPAGYPDPHAQARELLSGRDIPVPAAFTLDQVNKLTRSEDPRLKLAAAAADGQVVQFLAGAPELLARYRNAPSAAKALISAAIDARRLGMGIALPLGFLEAAAPGYLTGTEWDGLGDDWLERALTYTAADCKGARGLLTRIRPRPSQASGPVSGPAYRLTDYLDQHGRQSRRSLIPPAEFWTAAALFAEPGDLMALAEAAEAHGLLRDATCLYKRSSAHGDIRAAERLVLRLRSLHPADKNPTRWVTTQVTVSDPDSTAEMLSVLCEAGAEDQAKILADRAAHIAVKDPRAAARLLGALRNAGLEDQATVLADRAAKDADLRDPRAAARLLGALRNAGLEDQATILADRAAKVAALDPRAVAWLLAALRKAGLEDQATALADRAAAHAPLRNPYGGAWLLDALRNAGLEDQATILAIRAAKDADLRDPRATAWLLGALAEAGLSDQTRVLADRAANIPLDHSHAIPGLLGMLREAGAEDQARVLADRAAKDAALDNPFAIARLLTALQEAGAQAQANVLADRAKNISVDDPGNVSALLTALREAGAENQAKILADRAAAHTPFDNPGAVAALLVALRKAGTENQAKVLADRAAHVSLGDPRAVAVFLSALQDAGAENLTKVLADRAALHVGVGNPDAVATLLAALRKAGAEDQAMVLADRAAPHVPLGDSRAVARLLDALRRAGAEDQVMVLANRAAKVAAPDPSAVARLLAALREAGAEAQARTLADRAAKDAALGNPDAVARLLAALREAGAEAQARTLADRAAKDAALGNPDAVATLLAALRNAGAEDQASILVDRLPAEGMFDLFCQQGGRQVLYGFGREPDGSPAPPWGWGDLD